MKKILLYTSDTWPHCKTAKSFLREKEYEFEIRDLDTDNEAMKEFSELGLRGIPAFVIGQEVIEGLDTDRIETLMED